MKITSITRGVKISFKSKHPVFKSAGHPTSDDNKTSTYESTNQFYRQKTTNKGGNITFTGSPFNTNNHDSVSFKGASTYRHCADEDKEGCQPIRPQSKMPPTGGVLLYNHADTSGNVLDIKG